MENDLGISQEELEKISGGLMSVGEAAETIKMIKEYKAKKLKKEDLILFARSKGEAGSGAMMFPNSECTVDEFVSFVDKFWAFM